MDDLKNLAVDTLEEEIFLPEEKAYVKAVLMKGGYSCAEENIILCSEGDIFLTGAIYLVSTAPFRSLQMGI